MASEAPGIAIAPVTAPVVRAVEDRFNVAAHGLRGVAAMMVFLAHLLGGTAEHIYAANQHYVEAIKPYWHLGTYGVELFFVISGFVILPSVRRYTLGEFGLRRLLRLYPMFFAFSVLFVVLNGLTNAYPALNTPVAIVSGFLFLNLFTGTEQLTPNAWSLTFEVLFYLCIAVTWHVAFVRRSAILTLLAGGASLAFLASFPITLYFVVGVAIRIAHDRGLLLPQPLAAGLEALALALVARLAAIDHYEYTHAELADPAVVALIVATGVYFWLAVHAGSLTARLLGNRATLYLGTVSYSLYIVHPYVYLPVRMLFDRMGWFTPDIMVSMALFALAVTPPMLLATDIVHRRLERWPYARFFRQGIYKA
ncbi:acyltransferase family protein [Sandarakinorhabdus sp. DWP1-3-1]|uniref:acyltransferase family protein n=1 Tax=Sandarakinorhabdus sp. DWP1-3-1 TaxID=2804627 RepID=UPI003CF1F82E